MPKFLFYVHDGRELVDPDGVELAGDPSARIEAIRLAGAILQEDAEHIVQRERWNMHVTNADGKVVYQVDLSVTDPSISAQ